MIEATFGFGAWDPVAVAGSFAAMWMTAQGVGGFVMIVTAIVVAADPLRAATTTTRPTPAPPLITWLPELLSHSRQRALAGDPSLRPAVEKLRAEADAWLGKPLDAVTDKPAELSASGDPHDYASVSPYFWPNPDDPAAPWVMIDGKTNREMVEKFDGPRNGRMQRRVVAGTLAWYFSGDDRYARDAADQLRAWYLDPKTRMNPHLEYAQHVPNKSRGEPWGIIDLNGIVDVLNAAVLLRESGHWSAADEAGLREWMGRFSDWLVESDLGRREGRAANNHGTFYDLMLVATSRYAGREDRAREVIGRVVAERYQKHVQPDGSTPLEQKRVNAAMYTSWNLKGLADLAIAGRNLEPPIDVYAADPNRSLAKAAEWLVPFVRDPQAWPHGDRTFRATHPTEFFWLLRVLDPQDAMVRESFEQHMTPAPDHRWRLLYPLDAAAVSVKEESTTMPTVPPPPATPSALPGRWPAERINAWYAAQPWPCGFNYVPANAISYTEMFMPDVFDAALIDREMALAQEVGFNCVRVVLPFVVWEHDPEAFKARLATFLEICSRRGLKVMPALFDDCVFGNDERLIDPWYGPQPEVLEGWYANGWTPSPGHSMVRDPSTWPRLEQYVRDVVGTFAGDPRVWVWDLYNEPTNGGVGAATIPLLRNVIAWAREVGPSQPVTVGVWNDDAVLNDLALQNSDVISFHHYRPAEDLERHIVDLKRLGRPVINTEWLNRGHGSLVETCLPIFARERVGAMHWGLVNGRTQTHLPWGHRPGAPYTGQWQHDLFRGDHTPYDPREIELFRETIRSKP
jgi:hypothetical protein